MDGLLENARVSVFWKLFDERPTMPASGITISARVDIPAVWNWYELERTILEKWSMYPTGAGINPHPQQYYLHSLACFLLSLSGRSLFSLSSSTRHSFRMLRPSLK